MISPDLSSTGPRVPAQERGEVSRRSRPEMAGEGREPPRRDFGTFVEAADAAAPKGGISGAATLQPVPPGAPEAEAAGDAADPGAATVLVAEPSTDAVLGAPEGLETVAAVEREAAADVRPEAVKAAGPDATDAAPKIESGLVPPAVASETTGAAGSLPPAPAKVPPPRTPGADAAAGVALEPNGAPPSGMAVSRPAADARPAPTLRGGDLQSAVVQPPEQASGAPRAEAAATVPGQGDATPQRVSATAASPAGAGVAAAPPALGAPENAAEPAAPDRGEAPGREPASETGRREPDPATPRVPTLSATPPPVTADARSAALAPGQASFLDMADSGAPGSGWRLDSEAAALRGLPLQTSAGAVPPQHVSGQITLAIETATRRSVEIRLDPPELGRVQIQLNPVEGGLQATVLAERPETQEFLRRHAEMLIRDLGEAGYSNVTLDFAAGGQASPREQEAPARMPSLGGASAEAPRAAPQRSLAGGLDIRL